ncbi:MAG TPA: VOC family protein [Pyrinomonadaceae bacterium]|jgi:catechol 2,3-dioxygenase-like lactoylglutathione lyase family enzyme|nr:VOC family protein [Pyrinomonadaceae bacterium]
MSILLSSQVAAFIAVSDAALSRDFYENVLGLTVIREDDWAVEFDANGTSLRMQKGVTFTSQEFTVLGWHVDDIDAAMAELRERGVVFEQYPWMPPESNGVMTFPGGARVAWFKDPDGNVLSLDQY